MLKHRQMKMAIWATQEGGVQEDEAGGDRQTGEEKPEEAEGLRVVLGQIGMGRATVTMAYTTDTIRELCSGLADNLAGD